MEAIGLVAFTIGGFLALRFRVLAVLPACPIMSALGLFVGGVSAKTVILCITGSVSIQCGYFVVSALRHFGTRVSKDASLYANLQDEID